MTVTQWMRTRGQKEAVTCPRSPDFQNTLACALSKRIHPVLLTADRPRGVASCLSLGGVFPDRGPLSPQPWCLSHSRSCPHL